MPYYAVKKGKKTGLYTDWPSCQEQIKGFPNAEFHKFTDEKEALKYLMGAEIKAKPKAKSEIIKLTDVKQCNIYTGGAYVKGESKCNLAIIVETLTDKQIYLTSVEDEFCAKQQTIAAELLGAFVGIQIGIDKGYQFINLYSNWDGIKKLWSKDNVPKSLPACDFVRFLDSAKTTSHIRIGQLREVDKVQKKDLKYYSALAASTKYTLTLAQICDGTVIEGMTEEYDG